MVNITGLVVSIAGIYRSVDFMSDGLEDGRKIRILNVIDDYNREALATEVGLSFPSARVTRVLERLAFEHGYPEKLRVDNGPEYTANELKMYCEDKKIELVFIPPGKPHKNGFIERFNRTFREDVLDAYIFESLSQAQITSEKWRVSYNINHPHQALGGMSPVTFKYARHKIIEAYKQVKAKMNGSLRSPALTCSTAFNERTYEQFEEKSLHYSKIFRIKSLYFFCISRSWNMHRAFLRAFFARAIFF